MIELFAFSRVVIAITEHTHTRNSEKVYTMKVRRDLQEIAAQANVSYKEEELDRYQHQFVKAYLYNLFAGTLAHPSMDVIRMLGRHSQRSPKLAPLTVNETEDGKSVVVIDDAVEATLIYKESAYEITAYREIDNWHRSHYFISALGLDTTANAPGALLKTLWKEALLHSAYRNSCLEVVPLEEGRDLHVVVRPTQLEQTALADVFLSDTIAESLRFFVDCILSFDALRQPIRYLLSGKPGTGKTKIIRAIANETKGKATFILTNGSDERLDSVFILAEIFSPAVVCIDDVDLLIGNRELDEREKSLGKFLQRLDGFIDSGVFVLATTNDKSFVDMAASRPGRFDMVLNINPIEAKHYLSLIRSRTDYRSDNCSV